MSFISDTFNIGKKNMVVGNGKEDFNISSINGHEVRINGIVPGAGGGGGVPAVGDVSFIGNLAVNNTGVGGVKGEITFEGTDIYHQQIVNPGDPIPAPLSYVDYKQLAEKNENQRFVGQNDFAERVRIQLSDGASPPNYTDKITLNTGGNIECVDINNSTQIKSNSVICENGAPEDQLIKARQYHFRPNPTETTGWVFSQKQPDNPAVPEDNYLMLQNKQPTGSLNLVKSSFDPLNPTPFDIILDPQNGQVKTATSFDAPQVNFRKNAVDNWSIYQPPSGDTNETKLRIQNYQDNAGGVQILDNSNNIWVDFTNLFNTFNKPTFINDVLTVVGNTVINNSYSLLFGAYSFKPIQYVYSKSIEIRSTPDNTGYTNMVFNCLGTGQQPTLGGRNLWTNVNTGATNVDLYNNALEGFYKCSIKQTAVSSSGNFNGTEIIFDYILAASVQDTPDLTPPISYGYNKFPADRVGPALSTVASVLIDHKNTLSSQSQPVFLSFSDPPISVSPFETMTVQIKLTKLDF